MKRMNEQTKRRLTMSAALLGFVIVFAIPTLLHPNGARRLPMLVGLVAVCTSIFFINTRLLLPRWLFRGLHAGYICGVVLTVGVELGVMSLLTMWLETGEAQRPGPVAFEWLMPIFGMLFFSTLYGYFERERNNRKREIDLTHQNIEFEMKFLKSQINPHFLFNALNNIYALSVVRDERAPEMVLKLSDMLRFTLYDSEIKKVKLKREVEYINNYIEFQKLKADTDLNITVDTSNMNEEMMIEPMLLIPFIENSFKHGNISNPKKGWLQVEVKTLGPILIFKDRNSLPPVAINKDVVGGIGVENVRKRLDILYPGRYELEITTSETEFGVYMKIDTFA